MMPQLVTVRHRRLGGPWRRWCVPVLPVLLLLSPLLVLALVGGLVACRIHRISATGALWTAGRLFSALPGARFEIEDGEMAVLVSVR
ncbi:hypothetical protein HH310_01530 [Actinoplanes sp. TBRC 11911]|nr:hypothetical protein [Actinoplanes sp. TBRC 11911]